VIAAGLLLVGYAQLGAPREFWWLGLVFAALAGSCYAATNVITRAVQRARPVLFITLAGTTIGGMVPLLLIIAVQAATSGGAAFATLSWETVGIVLLAGVANAVALIGLTQAMRDSTVATTNTISSAQLVFSFIGAVLLFNETGSPPMILGVVLVTIGIIYAQIDRAGRRAEVPIAPIVPPAP
jgi:drug/metabolite transporter (DMT)-like permease